MAPAALHTKQALIMLKPLGKPALRNGDQRTKSARRRGSRDLYRPINRDSRSLHSTSATSAATCMEGAPLHRCAQISTRRYTRDTKRTALGNLTHAKKQKCAGPSRW